SAGQLGANEVMRESEDRPAGGRRHSMTSAPARVGAEVICLSGPLMSQKTWGGRFSGDTDPLVVRFTESISYDQRLFRHDIVASKAHARMLAEVGLLTDEEASAICSALDEIRANIQRGWFSYSLDHEDIHTHIERALIEKLGDIGRKLHTARSRNDQIVT